jgi:hypothetical protein
MSRPAQPKTPEQAFSVRALWMSQGVVMLRFTYRGRAYDFTLSRDQARETRDALDDALREMEGVDS